MYTSTFAVKSMGKDKTATRVSIEHKSAARAAGDICGAARAGRRGYPKHHA